MSVKNITQALATQGGELPQATVKPLVYGIGDSERLFVNHLMTCKQCRPRSALYCGDGLKLKNLTSETIQ